MGEYSSYEMGRRQGAKAECKQIKRTEDGSARPAWRERYAPRSANCDSSLTTSQKAAPVQQYRWSDSHIPLHYTPRSSRMWTRSSGNTSPWNDSAHNISRCISWFWSYTRMKRTGLPTHLNELLYQTRLPCSGAANGISPLPLRQLKPHTAGSPTERYQSTASGTHLQISTQVPQSSSSSMRWSSSFVYLPIARKRFNKTASLHRHRVEGSSKRPWWSSKNVGVDNPSSSVAEQIGTSIG